MEVMRALEAKICSLHLFQVEMNKPLKRLTNPPQRPHPSTWLEPPDEASRLTNPDQGQC